MIYYNKDKEGLFVINVIVEIYDFENNMYDITAQVEELEIAESLEKPCKEAKLKIYHNVFTNVKTNLPIYIQPRI